MEDRKLEVEKKLKLYLEENGIKQQFVCDKTGIDKVTLSNILNGKRKLTANELLVIAEAINVPLNFFTQ